MREIVYAVIKTYLYKHIAATRAKRKWPKTKMAEALDMDDRSYADIENGTSACSAVTFIIYLLFVLEEEDDRTQLLHDLQQEIAEKWGNVA